MDGELRRKSTLTLREFLLIFISVAVITSIVIAIATSSSNSPYPSEKTPLSLINNGIMWTCEWEYHKYSTYQFLNIGIINSTNYVEWHLSHPSLSNGTKIIKEYEEKVFMNLTWFLNVTDLTGDGIFSKGDYFTLRTSQAFFPDTVYKIRITYSGPTIYASNYASFAIHEDIFYTW